MAEQVTTRILDKLYATMEAALQPVCNYKKLKDMATALDEQSLRLDLEWLLHRQGDLETRMELTHVSDAGAAAHPDLVSVYISYIRPVMEYGAPVWHSGLSNSLGNKIEKVQRRAVRIIMGASFTSYSTACAQLGLPTLYARRHELTALRVRLTSLEGSMRKIQFKRSRCKNCGTSNYCVFVCVSGKAAEATTTCKTAAKKGTSRGPTLPGKGLRKQQLLDPDENLLPNVPVGTGGPKVYGKKDYEIVSPECGELRILRYNSGRHDLMSMIFGRQITAVKAKVKYKFRLPAGPNAESSKEGAGVPGAVTKMRIKGRTY
ncbi:hypothetical protein Bbelb_393740 [Branchiostoma belcheri]|nr:hypothetical protein Bbelb_393740 [Branchiostoma belcheri]